MPIKRKSYSGTRKRRRGVRKATFDRRVLSVLSKQQELKFTHTSFGPAQLGNIIDQTNGLWTLEPAIPQGNGEYQRQGNAINLKKMVLDMYVNMEPNPLSTEYDVTNSVRNTSNIIRLMILKQKNSQSGDDVVNGINSFQTGNLLENSTSYSGTVLNSLQDVNRTAFVLKRQRRIKLSPNIVVYTGGNYNVDNAADMCRKVRFVIRFGKAGKKLTYKTGGANTSQNFPYFLAAVAQNVYDGSAPQFCSIHAVSKWYYTDM